jgi:hypothetical protein
MPFVCMAQSVIKNVFLEKKDIKIVYLDTFKRYINESSYEIYKEDSLSYFKFKDIKTYIKPSINALDSVIANYIENNYRNDSISYGSSYPDINICFIIDVNGNIIDKGLVRGSTEKRFEEAIEQIVYKCQIKFPIYYNKDGKASAYFWYYYFGIP